MLTAYLILFTCTMPASFLYAVMLIVAHMLLQTLENLQDQMASAEVASTRQQLELQYIHLNNNNLPWRHISLKWHKCR